MSRRSGPLLLILSGALLLLVAGGWGLISLWLARPGAAPAPQALAGLPLASKATGPAAVAEVTRLHGRQFPLTSGVMASYGDDAAITLWVAGAPLRRMAAEMVRAMEEKIAEGRSPFTPAGTRVAQGRTLYELTGMGQRHFYFQSGALVVWLAADEPLAERALDEVLEYYP